MYPVSVYKSDVNITNVYYINKMTIITHDDNSIKIIKNKKIIKEYENTRFIIKKDHINIQTFQDLVIKNKHIILFRQTNNYLTIDLDNIVFKIPIKDNSNISIINTKYINIISIYIGTTYHIVNLLTKTIRKNLKIFKGNDKFISAKHNNKWCIYNVLKDEIITYFDNIVSYSDNDLFYDNNQIYHIELDIKNKCFLCDCERVTNKIIIPCGHTKLCDRCFTKVKNKCPICDKNCTGTIKIK